jgi:hypothetical protein
MFRPVEFVARRAAFVEERIGDGRRRGDRLAAHHAGDLVDELVQLVAGVAAHVAPGDAVLATSASSSSQSSWFATGLPADVRQPLRATWRRALGEALHHVLGVGDDRQRDAGRLSARRPSSTAVSSATLFVPVARLAAVQEVEDLAVGAVDVAQQHVGPADRALGRAAAVGPELDRRPRARANLTT